MNSPHPGQFLRIDRKGGGSFVITSEGRILTTMGTNYYLTLADEEEICDKCKKSGEVRIHIGKSSAGWVFSLHAHPSRGILDLEHWLPLLCNPKNRITDEYGRKIYPLEMLTTIMCRFHKMADSHFDPAFLSRNRARLTEHGLLRSTDHRAGAGTWDIHLEDFS